MEKFSDSLLNSLYYYNMDRDKLSKQLDKNTIVLYELLLNIIKIRCTIKIASKRLIENKMVLLNSLKNDLIRLEDEHKSKLGFDMIINSSLSIDYKYEIDLVKGVIDNINNYDDSKMIDHILDILKCRVETLDKFVSELDYKGVSALKGISFNNKPIIDHDNKICYDVIDELCEYISSNPSILSSRMEMHDYLITNEKIEDLVLLRKNSSNIILLEAKKSVEDKRENCIQSLINKLSKFNPFSPLRKYSNYVIETSDGSYLNDRGLFEELDGVKNKKGKTLELYNELLDIKMLDQRIKKICSRLESIVNIDYLYKIYEITDFYNSIDISSSFYCFNDEELFRLIDQHIMLLREELDSKIRLLMSVNSVQTYVKKLHILKKFPLEVNGNSSLVEKSNFLISDKFTYACGLKLIDDYDSLSYKVADDILRKIHGLNYKNCIEEMDSLQKKLYKFDELKGLPLGYQKKIK